MADWLVQSNLERIQYLNDESYRFEDWIIVISIWIVATIPAAFNAEFLFYLQHFGALETENQMLLFVLFLGTNVALSSEKKLFLWKVSSS